MWHPYLALNLAGTRDVFLASRPEPRHPEPTEHIASFSCWPDAVAAEHALHLALEQRAPLTSLVPVPV